jgi:hypothetical protein
VMMADTKRPPVTDGPFVVGIDALDFALAYDHATWDCLLLTLAGARTSRSNPILL